MSSSNDPFRKEYRKLSDHEIAGVSAIKSEASALLTLIEANVTDPRAAALAKTKLQESVFWATNGITG